MAGVMGKNSVRLPSGIVHLLRVFVADVAPFAGAERIRDIETLGPYQWFALYRYLKCLHECFELFRVTDVVAIAFPVKAMARVWECINGSLVVACPAIMVSIHSRL